MKLDDFKTNCCSKMNFEISRCVVVVSPEYTQEWRHLFRGYLKTSKNESNFFKRKCVAMTTPTEEPMYQLKTCLDIKLGDLITLNIFYESSRYNVVKKYVEKEIIMVGHFSARVGSSGPEACHSFIS